MTPDLVEKIGITFEVCGASTPSPGAAHMIQERLEGYPELAVSKALDKCMSEVKGRLSLADIISRIDDGRPGPEEAWAMIPRDEYSSVVWTEDMAQAFGIMRQLLLRDDGKPDLVGARMAFREAYSKIIEDARSARVPVKWVPSLGQDPMGRESALLDAVERGRLPAAHARDLCPMLPPMRGEGEFRQLPAPNINKLELARAASLSAAPTHGELTDGGSRIIEAIR